MARAKKPASNPKAGAKKASSSPASPPPPPPATINQVVIGLNQAKDSGGNAKKSYFVIEGTNLVHHATVTVKRMATTLFVGEIKKVLKTDGSLALAEVKKSGSAMILMPRDVEDVTVTVTNPSSPPSPPSPPTPVDVYDDP
ncbi:MAG TPA: hypothetical protein VFG68_09030 [Fimbriiglobus sp.]|nr:hypothetical protein [Fimbriiglobus sp.]